MDADRRSSTTPTSSCSTPAASGRTPTTSSTAHLGHLKALKDRRPDLQIVGRPAAWPRRTATLVRERAPHVDVVFGTHNVHRAADLLTERPRAAGRSSRSSRRPSEDARRSRRRCPPAATAGHAAWVTIQIGCDNSCAFCIVPAVRGPEISRPFGDIVDEVERSSPADGVIEVTLLGQNVNSYGRDLRRRGSRRARCSPTCCGAVGAVDGIRRVRFTSPHPKDLRPETIAAMAEMPDGVRAPPPARCSRAATASLAAHAPRLHRRALPRAAGRGPRRASPTSPSPPTSSSASPARPTTTSPARSRWSPRPRYDSAYTFVFSPRPGTEAAELVDGLRGPRRGRRSASSASGSSSSARALAKHAARVGPRRGGRSSRARQEGPDGDLRPHPPEQAGPLRAPTAARGRAPYATVEVTGAGAAPPARRPASRSSPRPATASASRSSAG